ncbi:hypothetical protein M5E87_02540 [Flavonifractor plautii]|nr:hypothetical protein M5E87_02540 [Flavonifractor plautii]
MALPKLIVVLGTTACGKSGLGVELAKRFGGEIVSADSRQVYRGLDLGTGKVTEEEMEGCPTTCWTWWSPTSPIRWPSSRPGPMPPSTASCPGKHPFLVGEPGCTSGR